LLISKLDHITTVQLQLIQLEVILVIAVTGRKTTLLMSGQKKEASKSK